MKKFWKAIYDGILMLVAYGVFAFIVSVVLAIAPIACIITALQNEIKLSEAFEQFMRMAAKSFYEAFEE